MSYCRITCSCLDSFSNCIESVPLEKLKAQQALVAVGWRSPEVGRNTDEAVRALPGLVLLVPVVQLLVTGAA